MPSNRWINTVESLDCRAESDAIGQYTKAHNDNIMVTIHAYRFYLDRMLARNPFCCGPGGVCGEGKKTTVNKQTNWKKSARKTEGSTWSARHMPESIEQCEPKKALNGVDLHANVPAHHAQMFEHFGISFFSQTSCVCSTHGVWVHILVHSSGAKIRKKTSACFAHFVLLFSERQDSVCPHSEASGRKPDGLAERESVNWNSVQRLKSICSVDLAGGWEAKRVIFFRCKVFLRGASVLSAFCLMRFVCFDRISRPFELCVFINKSLALKATHTNSFNLQFQNVTSFDLPASNLQR